MTWLLVALGAAVGAPLRYVTDQWIQRRHGRPFPWGILAVNTAGSLLLGFLAAGVLLGAVGDGLWNLLGTGLCGALTTYSTFSYDMMALIEQRRGHHALGYATASIGAGLAAAYLGAGAAWLLWGSG
ncbi:fluoride efflux transporter CrcB [Longispora urticae]